MKNLYLISIFSLLSFFSTAFFPKTTTIRCDQKDAKIIVDGKEMGTGEAIIKIPGNACIHVEIQKVGFISTKIDICNSKNAPKVQLTYYFELIKDESFDASIKTDLANIDIEINTDKSEEEAWKTISQIILSYFDILEITDSETGYLRTSWETQSFNSNTIRTRVILKQSSSNPLKYKIKLVSEHSGNSGTSVKNDEKFKEWDRVLKKYETLISEMQSRLK